MSKEQKKTVFAVFKIAVYRHECGGIFTSKRLAVNAARKLRDGERDDHHNYEVIPFVLDMRTEQTSAEAEKYEEGELLEPDAVADFTGGKDD